MDNASLAFDKSAVVKEYKEEILTLKLEGAQNYANIRSIVDTSRKRGLNEFETLQSVIKGYSVF